MDKIPAQMYKLTPKYGVIIREANNSRDNEAAPVKKMRKSNPRGVMTSGTPTPA